MPLKLTLVTIALALTTTICSAERYQSGDQQVQLLELYTSEGCSSCPPADRWLSRQQRQSGLWAQFVPVAFHVAYWNWSGWQDPYSSEKYDKRQRNYADEGAVDNIYTPGFFLNGEEWRGFFQHKRNLPKTSKKDVGNLALDIDGKQFQAHFSGKGAQQLHIAILGMGLSSKVTRGENRNKTLKHDFVVVGFGSYGGENSAWQGRLPLLMHEPESYAIAAWVTGGQSQRPIQTVGGEYNPDNR